ncbi:MAG: sigma-E factor negative regulatory protein [Kistimonas sp.]|nr:sigma-E factor negative regulatory protein [Kistimonas sp.]
MADAGKEEKDRTCESLSALLDDEASELDIQRVLSKKMPDIREQALRYRKTGAVISQGNPKFADVDLSSAISAAIADEPVPQPAPEPEQTTEQSQPQLQRPAATSWPWLGLGGGVVTAASVAFVVFLAANEQNGREGDAGISPLARQDPQAPESVELHGRDAVIPYRVQAGLPGDIQPQVSEAEPLAGEESGAENDLEAGTDAPQLREDEDDMVSDVPPLDPPFLLNEEQDGENL